MLYPPFPRKSRAVTIASSYPALDAPHREYDEVAALCLGNAYMVPVAKFSLTLSEGSVPLDIATLSPEHSLAGGTWVRLKALYQA